MRGLSTVRYGSGRVNVPVLDLLRHRQEGLLDICGVLSRGLQERDAELVREFLVEHGFHQHGRGQDRMDYAPSPHCTPRPSCS